MTPIAVSVVGCGNFARNLHLPNVAANPRYRLRLTCDVDPNKAEEARVNYSAEGATTSFDVVLRDPATELVVITTRHDLHADMAIRAARAGKHILLEKPMALTLSEAEAIAEEVRKAGVVFMMGFNRRFSPLGRKAKALLEGRHPPFALLYRMEDSLCTLEWVLDPKIGGGRILSESCHLFDLMGWLNGSPPVRLFARGGALTHPHLDTQDNLAAVVEFANGSIGTILHGDLGISSYPKERIEIFCNMATIVIDNFQRLQVAGIEGEGEMHLESVDKGWRQELDALADAIREGGPSPVGVEAGLTSMRCCLAAIESIRTGRAQILAE